jgi:hypothetical protein
MTAGAELFLSGGRFQTEVLMGTWRAGTDAQEFI